MAVKIMIQRPVAIGLLVCENAITEERSRNLSLINCFTLRGVAAFPSPRQKMAAVALLVNGLGDIRLDLIVHHLDNGQTIHQQKKRMLFADKLQEARAVFRFDELVFPEPGRYDVTLLADQELLALHAFIVLPKENG